MDGSKIWLDPHQQEMAIVFFISDCVCVSYVYVSVYF